MNRRQLLGLLAAAPAALIVPELLVPRRTFFLPPAGGWDVGRYREWERIGITLVYRHDVDMQFATSEPLYGSLHLNHVNFSEIEIKALALSLGVKPQELILNE